MAGPTGQAQPAARGEPEVVVLADADAVADAAAERIAATLRTVAERRGRVDWVTTGGSSPIGIYNRLARPPLRGQVPWPDVQVWWTDDRMVPRDHPLSNVLPFEQILLSATALAGLSGSGEDGAEFEQGLLPGVSIANGHLHPIPVSEAIGAGRPAAWAAEAYGHELRDADLPVSPAGWPIFDLILVGVGPDGHVFSVFPGSLLFDSPAWVSPVPAPSHVEPHVERVSLSPAILDAAVLPLVVVTGAGKADAVARALAEDGDVREVPARLARRSGAVWLLDEAAAARLPGR
jgi:6-phosphogluconolactonase